MNDIILYRAHNTMHLESDCFKHLSLSERDIRVLFDATDKELCSNAFNYVYDDIILAGLPIADEAQIEAAFGSGDLGKRFTSDKVRQIWYNCGHLPLMFYLENPNFDYYWSIEYDVYFHGNWDDFFSQFDNVKDDFLGVHVRNYKDCKEDKYWYLFPFDRMQYKKRISSFGTVQRYSNKLMAKVIEELKAGKHTYYEQLFPSVAANNKMKYRDLNDITPCYHSHTMAYETLNMYQIIHIAGGANKLFHPVR